MRANEVHLSDHLRTELLRGPQRIALTCSTKAYLSG
jgi:hypothetical protein